MSTLNGPSRGGASRSSYSAVTRARLRDLAMLFSILRGIGRPPVTIGRRDRFCLLHPMACCERVRSPAVGPRESVTHFHQSWRVLSRCQRGDHVRRRGYLAGNRTVGEIFVQNECSR